MKKNNSIQAWLLFEDINRDGIIKLKDSSYVKILKVFPINYHLKSNLEKEAILNSYHLFLKTCDFNIQILVHSNKEDLSKHVNHLKKQAEIENDKFKNLIDSYIHYIQKLNIEKKSSCKNFFILIKNSPETKKEINEHYEKILISNLNDKYFKIKECLSRCGNDVIEINNKKDIINIFYSLLNTRKFLKK